eukprot:31265-Pelagococcus_subviridis.AAC.2
MLNARAASASVSSATDARLVFVIVCEKNAVAGRDIASAKAAREGRATVARAHLAAVFGPIARLEVDLAVALERAAAVARAFVGVRRPVVFVAAVAVGRGLFRSR